MRRPRRKVALLSSLFASALLLSACAPAEENGEAEATTGAGEGDRTLVVYSGRNEALIGPLLEMFEEKSGIEIRVRYANSIEMAAQLLEEGDRTPAQVFLSQEAGALGALTAADMLAPLPASVSDAVDPAYNTTDGNWVSLTGRARVVLYDSENVTWDEAPGDVFALTEPEWNGRFGIAPTNAGFQSFVTAMRATEGEEVAEEWVRGLVDNGAQIFPGNNPLLEAVNTGALDVALINHYYWVVAAAEAGGGDQMRAQLKFGTPGSISALINVTGAGILAGAADSPEALEFVEFLVSEQAQSYFVEETGEYSLSLDPESPSGVPTLAELQGPAVDYSDLSDLEGTVELLQRAGLL